MFQVFLKHTVFLKYDRYLAPEIYSQWTQPTNSHSKPLSRDRRYFLKKGVSRVPRELTHLLEHHKMARICPSVIFISTRTNLSVL